MPDTPQAGHGRDEEEDDPDVMAGDRRISRPDSALPDWHIPDAHYRPIPIVWLTGAALLQMVVLFGIFVVLSEKHGTITIVLSAFATGMIGSWTWMRGMAQSSQGWKTATVIVLLTQFGLVALAATPRI